MVRFLSVTNVPGKISKSMMICQPNGETYELAAEDNDCKSGILLKWNHPVFHKFIAQSAYPTLLHFTTIASLFQGTVAWMAPCYIIMIFLHNAAKRAHSTQKTLCKPQQRCQLLPWSTKHRLIKNLICQDLQRSLLLVRTFDTETRLRSLCNVCPILTGRKSRPSTLVNTVTTLCLIKRVKWRKLGWGMLHAFSSQI